MRKNRSGSEEESPEVKAVQALSAQILEQIRQHQVGAESQIAQPVQAKIRRNSAHNPSLRSNFTIKVDQSI